MSISVATNIASLRSQTILGQTTQALSTTFQRLSSGLRINSPSDDAAGFSVAESLKADAKVAAVAIRNANDGVSLVSVTDTALDNISTLLTRMSELATQSASATYTAAQRSALATEFVALGSEIERIAVATEFNDMKLLSNSSNITIQVGFNGTASSQITISAITGTLNSLGLTNGGSALSFSITGNTSELSISASQLTMSALSTAIDTVGIRRGMIGAAESRLGIAINNLQAAKTSFEAAESRIRDADVAEEVANMVRLRVLQDSGAAVLAQANQQPQIVLKLLE